MFSSFTWKREWIYENSLLKNSTWEENSEPVQINPEVNMSGVDYRAQ